MTTNDIPSDIHPAGPDLMEDLALSMRAIQCACLPDDAIEIALHTLCQLSGATFVTYTQPSTSAGGPDRLIRVPAMHTNGPPAGETVRYPVRRTTPGACVSLHFAKDDRLEAEQGIAVDLLVETLGAALSQATQQPGEMDTSILAAGNELSELLWPLTSPDDVRQHCVAWVGARLDASRCLIVNVDPDTAIFPEAVPRMHVWSRASTDAPAGQADIVLLRSLVETERFACIRIESRPEVDLVLHRNEGQPDWTAAERNLARYLARTIEQHLNRTQQHHDDLHRSQNLGAIQQITSAASGATDLNELYRLVHDAVEELIPHNAFLIALRPPGNHVVTMVYRAEGRQVFPQRTAIPSIVHALELARPLLIDDIIDGSGSPGDRFGDPERRVRSAVSVPMMSEGSPIGLIIVQNYEPRRYNWDTAELLQSIALSVVGTFERLMLLDRIERQTRRDVGLRTVAERLGTTLDTDTLITIASRVIHDTIPGDLVLVFVINRQTRKVRTVSFRTSEPGFEPPAVGQEIREHSLSVCAIESSEQIIEPDYGAYARRENIKWTHPGPAVATPIPIDDQHAGVIVLARKEVNAFEADDLSLMRQIAAMLSTALQNTIAHAERLRHAGDLVELQRLSSTIAAQLDLEKSLDAIAQAAPRLVGADSCAVGMLDGPDMVRVAAHGSLAMSIPMRMPLEALMLAETMRSTEPFVLPDVRSSSFDRQAASVSAPDTSGWLAMSLIDSDSDVVGIMCLMTDEPRIWTDRDRSLLATLASAAGLAVQNARHFERTRDLLTASVESLAAAVEAKDPHTQNHSRQVAMYGRRIAEHLELDAETIGHIELAGLLHDVGKIGIPDSVLEKPGPLDGAGWAAMQLHPVIGEQILGGNPILNPLLAMVRHHHERWDGHGYPDRLRGDAIPLGASTISLAEALDTMTSQRPYRAASPWEESLAEIQACSGSQFAPHVVSALMAAIEDGAFDDLKQMLPAGLADAIAQQPRNQPLDMRALRIFDEVAQEIRAGTDLATFISRIVHTLNDILEISLVTVFLLDEESGELVLMEMLSNTTNRMQHNGRIPVGRGIVGWVAEHGIVQNIADVHKDPRFIDVAVSLPTRSELTVPLIAEGSVIGVLNLESDRPGAFSEMDERLLESTAGHLANAIQVISLHQRLKKLAVTDALTGLDNHRALFDRLVHEVVQAADNGTNLSIAILDVNNLKAVNDTYGHLTGDAALRAVAEVLTRHQREGDVIARYGGDEFALILPGASSDDAWVILESISADLRVGEFETEDVTFPLPTASWGVSTYPVDGRRPAELLSVADERMYLQKQTTRL